MAIMADQKPTEYAGEREVWEALSRNLPDDVVVYSNREINGREYDFTLLIKNVGILVIEVKGWQAKNIVDVAGIDQIIIEGYKTPQKSPKKQARVYRFDWVNYLMEKYGISILVLDMVCYPFLSEREYREKKLNIISEPEYTLFQEDLVNKIVLGTKIMNIFQKKKALSFKTFDDEVMQNIRSGLEPSFVVREKSKKVISSCYSILKIFNKALSASEIKELVDAYFNGVKSFLFVTQKEDMQQIVNAIYNQLSNKNIVSDKNDLKFGKYDGLDHFHSIGEEGEFRIFNFELYFLPKQFLSIDEFSIYEGKTTKEEEQILKELSSRTKFNAEQYIIEHASCEKHILVRAGAGTGKTYSMVSRISFLCNKKECEIGDIVQDIAMVTFTNEAADNMKKRLKRLFENYFVLTRKPKYLSLIEAVDQMQISTIHKFSKKLIQEASMKLGFGHEFTVTSGNYVKEIIYDKYLNEFIAKEEKNNPNVVKDLRIPVYQFRKHLMNFSKQLYNKSFDIKKISIQEMGKFEAIPFFNDIIQEVVIKAEKEYAEKNEKTNKIDLQNFMMLMERVTGADYIKEMNLHYKYLFIDEFQDTDDCQIRAFLNIKNGLKGVKFFVVGDLKQSIYRFRGAKTSAFEQLGSDDGTWLAKNLTTNYRTDNRLLKQFDVIFSGMGEKENLPYKVDDKLKSSINTGIDDSKLIQCYKFSGKDKVGFFKQLFDVIKKGKNEIAELSRYKNLSKDEKKLAILVRENWQVAEIVKEGRKKGIKIQTQIGGNLYQLEPAIDLYKLCVALGNSRDLVSLYNLIDSNYIRGSINIQGLHGMEYTHKLELLESVLNSYFEKIMGNTWRQLIKRVHDEPILKMLKEIYEAAKPWSRYAEDVRGQQFYKVNLELIIEKLVQNYSMDYLTLGVVSNSLKINIVTSQEEASRDVDVEEEEGTVLCTTIHKSKGLEYGTVILPYTNQRIDTLKKAELDVMYAKNKLSYGIKLDGRAKEYNSNYDEKEEIIERINDESRVLYVALTRAIRNVIWFEDTCSKSGITWKDFMEV